MIIVGLDNWGQILYVLNKVRQDELNKGGGAMDPITAKVVIWMGLGYVAFELFMYIF